MKNIFFYLLFINFILSYKSSYSSIFNVLNFDSDVITLAAGKSENGIFSPVFLGKIERALKIIRKRFPPLAYLHAQELNIDSLLLIPNEDLIFGFKALERLENLYDIKAYRLYGSPEYRYFKLKELEDVFEHIYEYCDITKTKKLRNANIGILFNKSKDILYDFIRIAQIYGQIEGIAAAKLVEYKNGEKCIIEKEVQNSSNIEFKIENEASWLFTFMHENLEVFEVCYNPLIEKIIENDEIKSIKEDENTAKKGCIFS